MANVGEVDRLIRMFLGAAILPHKCRSANSWL